jgi:hypothetical protein
MGGQQLRAKQAQGIRNESATQDEGSEKVGRTLLHCKYACSRTQAARGMLSISINGKKGVLWMQ